MLVVKKEITFIDGLIKKQTLFHIISQARIDFINNEIEVQISHFINDDELNLEKSDYISSYLIETEKLSDTKDLILQCWGTLANKENSIFFNASLEER